MVIIPHRGDVVWLDFEPQLGREIKKRRPAVLLSPYNYNTIFQNHINSYQNF